MLSIVILFKKLFISILIWYVHTKEDQWLIIKVKYLKDQKHRNNIANILKQVISTEWNVIKSL